MMNVVRLLLAAVLLGMSLCTSAVTADRRSVFDVSESKEEAPPRRTRHVLAAAMADVDPFSNTVVLAENEHALLRALGDKYGSIPYEGKGVSRESQVGKRRHFTANLTTDRRVSRRRAKERDMTMEITTMMMAMV
jgi:hypothetical protein